MDFAVVFCAIACDNNKKRIGLQHEYSPAIVVVLINVHIFAIIIEQIVI